MPEGRDDNPDDSADAARQTQKGVERLHDAYDRATRAHADAKRAFDRLEEAHQRGDPGIEEHDQFGTRLREMRDAAADVRQRADEVRRRASEERRQRSEGKQEPPDGPD